MNKVILSGNLCKDIELRKTNSGKSVTSNTIAVKRELKNAAGEYDTDFIDIVVWGNSAEYLSKYGHKGDRAEIVGRWQNRTYETNNGSNRTVAEVQVENISIFSKKPATTQPDPEPEDNGLIITDDDLPF